MSESTGIGVIGLGIIGNLHIQRLLATTAPAHLAAVVDKNEALTGQFAEQHGTYGARDVPDLLAREDVEAVIIAVPSGLHKDLTIAALQAGKHVLLEKPIEVDVAGADAIRAAEREAGTVLTVASQRRFAPAHQFLKSLLERDGLGRITSATVEVPLWRTQEYYDSAGWRGTWAMDGGGALMNQGVHLVDLALWLLGDVEEVYAHTGLLAHENVEVEDTVTITARLRSGGLLTFLATTAAYGAPPIRVNIMGDQGSVITVKEQITSFSSVDHPEVPEFDEADQPQAQLHDFIEAVQRSEERRVG